MRHMDIYRTLISLLHMSGLFFAFFPSRTLAAEGKEMGGAWASLKVYHMS